MNLAEIESIVNDIRYKPDWVIACYKDKGGRCYLQGTVRNALDSVTREFTAYRTGKVYLSEFMCKQEIVGAAYGLILAAETHEMREWFRYQGASIYNPHIDPDALVEVAKYGRNFNCRDNAMSMVESGNGTNR